MPPIGCLRCLAPRRLFLLLYTTAIAVACLLYSIRQQHNNNRKRSPTPNNSPLRLSSSPAMQQLAPVEVDELPQQQQHRHPPQQQLGRRPQPAFTAPNLDHEQQRLLGDSEETAAAAASTVAALDDGDVGRDDAFLDPILRPECNVSGPGSPEQVLHP